ncbi:MAG: DUF4392 domain-containing protein [Anaerolineales bacterium]|nr:DUF4392 domain-containing protein [Anaerolineales bacterium]
MSLDGDNLDAAIQEIILDDPNNRGHSSLYHSLGSEIVNQFSFVSRQIRHHISAGSRVGLLTGFPVNGLLETDGPFGIAVLFNQFMEMQCSVEIWSSSLLLPSLKQFFSAINLVPDKYRMLPIGATLSSHQAKTFLENSSLDLLIAVETPGQNRVGVFHNMHGQDISPLCADFDSVFQIATQVNIMTVGIGDGGNELGLGSLGTIVRNKIPFGSVCVCSCQQGIASVTDSQYPFPGGISNWVAYGLAAALAHTTQTKFLHSSNDEEKFLNIAQKKGLVDGCLGKPNLSVDGVALPILRSKIDAITELLK